jgi:hypothetical protein
MSCLPVIVRPGERMQTALFPVAVHPGEGLLTEPTPAVRPWSRERIFMVESRCGAVTVGWAYLFPPLSSGGASLAQP